MVLSASLLAAAGCHRAHDAARDIRVETTLQPEPVRVGNATITLRIADGQANPVRGAQVQIEGDMAHPGMAPVFHDAQPLGPGSYAGTMKFDMPGDWVLLEHIRLTDGRRIERQVAVNGVAAQ
ncbi:MAG TPA: FixH family protein [Acidobacteriaceae bacterium]|nr:FixH family protein [Acidobacteriaceae bacterium]